MVHRRAIQYIDFFCAILNRQAINCFFSKMSFECFHIIFVGMKSLHMLILNKPYRNLRGGNSVIFANTFPIKFRPILLSFIYMYIYINICIYII